MDYDPARHSTMAWMALKDVVTSLLFTGTENNDLLLQGVQFTFLEKGLSGSSTR
jgi:hypothetical protein